MCIGVGASAHQAAAHQPTLGVGAVCTAIIGATGEHTAYTLATHVRRRLTTRWRGRTRTGSARTSRTRTGCACRACSGSTPRQRCWCWSTCQVRAPVGLSGGCECVSLCVHVRVCASLCSAASCPCALPTAPCSRVAYHAGVKVNNAQALDEMGLDRKRLARLSVESYLQQILRFGFFVSGALCGQFPASWLCLLALIQCCCTHRPGCFPSWHLNHPQPFRVGEILLQSDCKSMHACTPCVHVSHPRCASTSHPCSMRTPTLATWPWTRMGS